ncbi:MAG TPA: biotin transporter BioY [Candidatus Eisenbacteria bacterium]|nr:biotin transporter BioY [Candidatus Eisenbacteria bacterium]
MSTLAEVLRPRFARGPAGTVVPARIGVRVYDVLLVLAGSALIALSAQVAVPLPFSPVPVTGQTFAVLLVGAALGATRGTAAVLAYLAEGAAGFPVFAGGLAGPAVLLGPTGGYLFGFLPAAWICGALAERGWDRRFLTTLASMALGDLAIFAVGIPWLARFVGAENAITFGLAPFVAGNLAKVVLAAGALPLAWAGVRRIRGR